MSEKKRKILYRCEYTFKDKMRVAYSRDGIAVFKDGFWINEAYQFTTADDCRYWIPPNAIQYIAKDHR